VITRTGWLVRGAGLAIAVAILSVLPYLFADFRSYEFARTAIFFIAITGLNILTGYAGQISLGHGAFMAIGAYTTAILAADHGVRELWTIPLAGVVAGIAGFLFGFPALRFSGVYLALATFGIAIAVPSIAKRFEGLTGGGGGKLFNLPSTPFGLGLTPNKWLYFLSMGIGVVLFVAAWFLLRGRTGRALRAIRDNEIAATASGVDLTWYKTLAFGISAFYAGIAGSLLAITVGYVNPDTFPISLSILLLTGVVVAGLGSLWGLVLGAIFIQYVPIYTQKISQQAPTVVYGLILIGLMFLLPGGVGGLLQRLVAPLTKRAKKRHISMPPRPTTP
jgi:branched-chain amino acid transport system permease protein